MTEFSKEIISTSKINKIFPNNVRALEDFTFSVKKGEVLTIIGPSGSGKSTLLRCLNGLEEIDNGTITVDDIPFDNNSANRNKIVKKIGMVFQSFNLFPHLTVLENISMAPKLVRGISKKESEAIAMDLLKKVNIPDKSNEYPDRLSGGQQQRVALARALVVEPKVLLLDEPSAGMNPQETIEITAFIKTLRDLHGYTILVIEHKLNVVRTISDRVIALDYGVKIAEGSYAEVSWYRQVHR